MPMQRSDVYFVNLNPVQGREQAGQRPVLVLSIDAINRLPLVVTVVVGTKGENITRDYPTTVDTYGHLIPGANRQAVGRLDDNTAPNLRPTSNKKGVTAPTVTP